MTITIVQARWAEEFEKGKLSLDLVTVYENVTTKGLRKLRKFYPSETWKLYVTQ